MMASSTACIEQAMDAHAKFSDVASTPVLQYAVKAGVVSRASHIGRVSTSLLPSDTADELRRKRKSGGGGDTIQRKHTYFLRSCGDIDSYSPPAMNERAVASFAAPPASIATAASALAPVASVPGASSDSAPSSTSANLFQSALQRRNSSDYWSCRQCTLINSNTVPVCGACHSTRPFFPIFNDLRGDYIAMSDRGDCKLLLCDVLIPEISDIVLSYSVWMPVRGERCDALDHSNVWRVASILELRARTASATTTSTATAESDTTAAAPPTSTGVLAAIRSLFSPPRRAVQADASTASSSAAAASANTPAVEMDALIHFIGCDLLWDCWIPRDSPRLEPYGSRTQGKSTGTMINTQAKSETLRAMGFSEEHIHAAEQQFEWNASIDEMLSFLVLYSTPKNSTLAAATEGEPHSPSSSSSSSTAAAAAAAATACGGGSSCAIVQPLQF